ncbi:MAG: YbgA family protein [Desulfobulbus sp.]
MNEQFPRPRILVSRCLGFAACRYDGAILKNSFVEQLQSQVDLIPVCPEADCGLGIPRPPIRLCSSEQGLVVYQPATSRDVTARLQAMIATILTENPQVDGAILKSKSPSCGLFDAKIYQGVEKPQPLGKGAGVFGEQVLRHCVGGAIDDEMRLTNIILREHFLIKAFTLARIRELSTRPTMGALVAFHASHKLLFLAYNQSHFRLAGKIVANQEKLPVAEVVQRYREQLVHILETPMRIPGVINTLYHAFGWISEHLGAEEKQYLINTIEEYRDERLPLQAVTRLIEAHALRFSNEYLLSQIFLRPYPRALAGLHDSGRGREVR